LNRTAEAAVISSIMQIVLEITAIAAKELPDDVSDLQGYIDKTN
jgi:hypothetical protein